LKGRSELSDQPDTAHALALALDEWLVERILDERTPSIVRCAFSRARMALAVIAEKLGIKL
jgi:hypothetical protein